MIWKSTSGQLLYRIGDVIISTNSENPATFFGGTWQLLCPGRTLVCVDTSDTDFNAVKKTGGSKYLQSHSHEGSITNAGNHTHIVSCSSAGNHRHKLNYVGGYFTNGNIYSAKVSSDNATHVTAYEGEHTHSINLNDSGGHVHSTTIKSTGSGNAENLQPFMAVYMWVRIA